jgi:hypothetical protein
MVDIHIGLHQTVFSENANLDSQKGVVIGDGDRACLIAGGVRNSLELVTLVADTTTVLVSTVAVAFVPEGWRSVVNARPRIVPLLVADIVFAGINVLAHTVHLFIACRTLALILALLVDTRGLGVSCNVAMMALSAFRRLTVVVVDALGGATVLHTTHF